MSLEATAEALATDTAMPVDAPVESAEDNEDSEMSALFDSMSDDGDDPDAPATPEPAKEAADVADEADDDEPPADEPVEATAAPSDIPYAIKQHWDDIPETARTAILDSQREMGRKLADQGRQVQGIAPIRDVLTQAVKDIPALANMRPDEAATQIFKLAKLSNDFTSKPVDTLMGYIQKHGLGEQMGRALAGLPNAGQAQNTTGEIDRLNREVKRLSDPEFMRSNFETFNTQSQVNSSVAEFAGNAEHWGAVEDHMPAAIQYLQATLPNASTTDVLQQAYELAVSQHVPDAQAKLEVAAPKAAPIADPQRSKAALKAKSANVQSRASGKSKVMTEDEVMAAAYDKMQT